jgi:hypothetical protein
MVLLSTTSCAAGLSGACAYPALREVAALAARRRDLQRLASGGLPDLEDDDVMRAAWQQ